MAVWRRSDSMTSAAPSDRNINNQKRTQMRSEDSRKVLASAIPTIALLLIIGMLFVSRVESKMPHNGIATAGAETTQEKIARAMSAGPGDISVNHLAGHHH